MFTPDFGSAQRFSQNRPSKITALERYWRQLRGARTLPMRSDIDPVQIDEALPYTFIGERMAPGIVRLRVTGQRMNDMVEADARGMPLSTIFSIVSRPALAAEADLVFLGPAVVEIPVAADTTPDREIGRLLLLPLEGPKGDADRLMGALVISERVRRLVFHKGSSIRREILPPLRNAEMARSLRAQEEGPERLRPALRLVVSND